MGFIKAQSLKDRKEFFCDDRSLLSLSSDLKTIRACRSDKKNEVVASLEVYTGGVGCKMPHEDVVVIPYQDVKPAFE